jgi:hypothetical protein
MCVVNQAVEYRIGVGGIAYEIEPFWYGELACYQGRTTPIPVFEDLQKMVPGIGVERFKPPYVDDPLLASLRVFGRSDRLRSYVRPL